MSATYPGSLITKNPVVPNDGVASGIWTLSEQAYWQKQGEGVWTAIPADPYFKNVALLLNGDGTNGTQNNTFIDSSSNNITLNKTSYVTQGSFNPYGSNWSMYDSGGTYLTTSYTGSVATNGDFTVEGWFNLSAYPSNSNMVVVSANLSIIAVQNNGQFSTYMPSSGWVSHGAFPLNQWNYCVVQRSGGTVSSYLNGSRLDSYSGSEGWTYNTLEAVVGQSAVRQVGYYSNVRISIVARYSGATMTVPTAPITPDASTTFLLCSSNRFIDASGNNRNVTVNGTPQVQPFSPFKPTSEYSTTTNGGSATFQGSSYLDFTNSAAQVGSNDFTFETWFYPTDEGPYGGGGSVCCIGGNGNGYFGFNCNMTVTYGYGSGWSSGSGWYSPSSSVSSVKPFQWYHIAITRSSGNITQYLNGVSIGTGSFSNSKTGSENFIGFYTNRSSNYDYTYGSMSGWRLVIGSVVYTGNFTPPTAPPANITNTALLPKFTDAGISDLATQINLVTVGNAQVSTSVKKYGTGSLYFDGSSYLNSSLNRPLYQLGSGDFTLEAWVYVTSTSGSAQTLMAKGTGAGNQASYVIQLNSNGTWVYNLSSNGSTWAYADVSMGTNALNTWQHIALVRSGSTFTPYLNGVAGTPTTSSLTLFAGTASFTIGSDDAGTNKLYGYVDELRVTKGVARYTANFTPPTAAFLKK